MLITVIFMYEIYVKNVLSEVASLYNMGHRLKYIRL